MNSNNYNCLIKLAAAPPVINPATGGTRIPGYGGFVGGPTSYMVRDLQRYGLPMTPASYNVNPANLSEAETQLNNIQHAEKQNQFGKERNRQNLDAYFARLTALNNANKAAGRPTYNPTALDLYAPYVNMNDPKSRNAAYRRMNNDALLSSASHVAAQKGTPYNPAELNSLRYSVPQTPDMEDVRVQDADYYNFNDKNTWMYKNFGPHALSPYQKSQQINYGRRMPLMSLSDYSENAKGR